MNDEIDIFCRRSNTFIKLYEILMNCREPIIKTHLAGHTGIGYNYFSKLFHHLIEYEFIAETEPPCQENIKRIHYELTVRGYAAIDNFNRLFKMLGFSSQVRTYEKVLGLK